jgi:SAM-dependent methyltransferase
MRQPNAQYNVARPGTLAVRIATRVRAKMYRDFIDQSAVSAKDTILDVGATSDRSYASSNYLEALHPFKDRITACGIDDASFLERLYPGVRFVFANALNLPFADGAFDFVHSSAVLEHVGSYANQTRLVGECARVARKGIFLTTPNRWFPVEFHTQLPLLHWLPKPQARRLFKTLGLEFFADEANLNLMSRGELKAIGGTLGGYRIAVRDRRLLGWPSNLLLVGQRLAH